MQFKSFIQISVLAVLLAAVALPARASKDNPLVRETLGTVECKGWEKSLTRGNPNLKHWHWNPIYSNVHCYKHVKAGAMPLKNDVRFKQMAKRPDRLRYQRPNHGAMPIGRNMDGSQRANPDVHSTLVSHDLNGALYRKQVEAELSARKAQAQKEVEARLAHKNVSAQIAVPTVKSYLYKPVFSDDHSYANGYSRRQTKTAVYGQLASKRYGSSTRF